MSEHTAAQLKDSNGFVIQNQYYDSVSDTYKVISDTDSGLAALQGTQGTGASYNPPTGGSGIFGWLSGIFRYAIANGETSDSAATSSSASWSTVALLKGLFSKGRATRATATSVSSQVATSYAAGSCVGTLLTFSNFLNTGVETGVLNSIGLSFDSANLAAIIDVYVFNANPSASTITDGAAFVLDSTDTAKMFGPFPVALVGALGAFGTSSHFYSGNLMNAITGTTSGTLYAVLVTESALTLTTLDLQSVRLGGFKD